jgi:hypothetical protein
MEGAVAVVPVLFADAAVTSCGVVVSAPTHATVNACELRDA